MHPLSCLSADKDHKNENIHLYKIECNENMTKSCYASFRTFSLYYETNHIRFLGSQMIELSHFYELCGCKDLGEVQLEHGCKLSRRRRIK